MSEQSNQSEQAKNAKVAGGSGGIGSNPVNPKPLLQLEGAAVLIVSLMGTAGTMVAGSSLSFCFSSRTFR
jgi:hypothetical protein